MAKNGGKKQSPVNADELKQILAKELEAKRQKCWAEIGAVLQKYKLKIQVQTILAENRILHQMILVEVPPEGPSPN